MKFKRKATGATLSRALLLLVLLLPGAVALGQTDNFFYIGESSRDGTGTSSWNGLGMSGDGLGVSGDGTWDGYGFNGDGLGMSGDGMWGAFGFEGDNAAGEASWEGFEEGNPLPTGTGLLAISVSGLCYAGLKRRRDSKIQRLRKVKSKIKSKMKLKQNQTMRRTLLLMVVSALLLTQCRKQAALPTSGPANENTVSMTVTVGYGSKTDINCATGAVTWSTGDRLYVGAGGKYIGYLTLVSGAGETTGTFSGTVSAAAGSYTFGFYYLGDRDYTPTLFEGTSTSVDIPFGTQTGLAGDLGDCHIGYDTATGSVDGNSITIDGVVLMTSKVAIAYFDFKDGTPEKYRGAITLSGEHICNSMTVGFDGSFAGTAGTAGKGISLTDNTSSQKYVMLVPTGTGEETLNFGVGATGSTKLHKGIEANKFYCWGDGEPIGVNVKPIEFSVSETTTVSFSPGNLQYIGSASVPYWKFADRQYDYIGGGQGVAGTKFNRDLFGWGCTGHQDARSNAHTYQTNYQPYSTDNASVGEADPAYGINDYGYGPDYTSSAYGLTVEDMSDWGSLDIGTDAAGTWRTLTRAEWVYLLNTRTTETTDLPNASSRYAKVTVEGVSGLLVFPDSFAWDATKMGAAPTKTNNASAAYTTGSYTAAEFAAQELSGVVFLPAAGYRDGTDPKNVGSGGYYWSSSCYSSSRAYRIFFTSSDVNSQNNYNRYYGFSVRLVR